MRRRPKLERTLQRLVSDHDLRPVRAHAFMEALDAEGYDIIEKRTRQRDRERQHQAQRDADEARRDRASIEARWLRDEEESRRLRARCSFLYEQAIAAGARPADLVGPS